MPPAGLDGEPAPGKGALKPNFPEPGPSLCGIMESSTSVTGSSELGPEEIKTPSKQDSEFA